MNEYKILAAGRRTGYPLLDVTRTGQNLHLALQQRLGFAGSHSSG